MLLTIHLNKFNIGLALENLNLFKRNGYDLCHIRVTQPKISLKNVSEDVYLLIKSRAIISEVRNKKVTLRYGYIPYWITRNDKELYVYDKLFKRIFSRIYFHNSESLKAIIIYFSSNMEFCTFLISNNTETGKKFMFIALRIM